jgi:RNA polymerase subunit RPABC4/transcription elongation factor Spt4
MDNIKNHTIKCSKCGRYFIDCDQERCPFCKKEISRNVFGDIFGEDNPFDSFGRT